jgi:hypothetical protein
MHADELVLVLGGVTALVTAVAAVVRALRTAGPTTAGCVPLRRQAGHLEHAIEGGRQEPADRLE